MLVKPRSAGTERDLAQTEVTAPASTQIGTSTARRFRPSKRKTTAWPGTYLNCHQHKGNKS